MPGSLFVSGQGGGNYSLTMTVASVPEPSSLTLLSLAAISFLVFTKRLWRYHDLIRGMIYAIGTIAVLTLLLWR